MTVKSPGKSCCIDTAGFDARERWRGQDFHEQNIVNAE
jgi:hypothetical protein